MKSNYAAINRLSHKTVVELNERILSGEFSPLELADWLEAKAGLSLGKGFIELHAKDVRNNAGLSRVLRHRQLDGLGHLSAQAIQAELGDLGQLLALIPERIKFLEAELKHRAQQTHRPPKAKVIPYAGPQDNR